MTTDSDEEYTAGHYANIIARRAVSVDDKLVAELLADACEGADRDVPLAEQGEAHEEIVMMAEESAERYSQAVIEDLIRGVGE